MGIIVAYWAFERWGVKLGTVILIVAGAFDILTTIVANKITTLILGA